MTFLHEEEGDHNHIDEKKEYGAEDRYSSEPQKAYLTGEFVIEDMRAILFEKKMIN